MRVRRRMARYGLLVTALNVCCAAVPGTAFTTTSASRSAAASPPSSGPTTSASVSGGRLASKDSTHGRMQGHGILVWSWHLSTDRRPAIHGRDRSHRLAAMSVELGS
jgi:hypothetical protein